MSKFTLTRKPYTKKEKQWRNKKGEGVLDPAPNFSAIGVKWKHTNIRGLLILSPQKRVCVLNNNSLMATGNLESFSLPEYIEEGSFKDQAEYLKTFKSDKKALKWFSKLK